MYPETISPQQLAKEGQAAYKRGDLLGSARAFEAAAQAYRAAGDLLSSAEMLNNASVALLKAGDARAALSAVEDTVEIFADAGDTRRQGMAYGNRAAALDGLGRVDEAINAYQQSADLLQLAGEDALRANALQALSMLHLRSGRQVDALVSMQDGLDGVKHPSPKQRFVKELLKAPFRFLK